MNVQFNGSSMQASMDGMSDMSGVGRNKIDTSIFQKLRHGTVLAVFSLAIAFIAICAFLVGWVGSRYCYDIIPSFIQNLMGEIGILAYVSMYIRYVCGAAAMIMAALSAIIMSVSLFMIVKGKMPMTNSVKWTGVICDAVAVTLALVVVIVAAISFML